MIKEVLVFGQRELVFLCQKRNFEKSILISIGNPSKKIFNRKEDEKIPSIFKKKFKEILRLEFYDVGNISDLQPNQIKRIPEKEDVKKVIKFYLKYKNNYDSIVIHCWGGVSRSTAISLIILYDILRDEKKSLDVLGKIREEVLPNPKILQYIDEIYNTKFLEKRFCVIQNYKERLRKIIFNLENEGIEEIE